MSTPLLSLYHRLQRWPAGSWLFSRAVHAGRPPQRAQPHRHGARDRDVQPGRADRRADGGCLAAQGHALDSEGHAGAVPGQGTWHAAGGGVAGTADRGGR
ncbi:hypothetical protein G6F68_015016 [Rhizopus microsporus]|nr:hypothetical protein G6F68_015016 [Rhizopus microsporus]